jgi:hypothetical protein
MALVVKLEPNLDRAVAVIAAQQGVTKADVIAHAVEDYVKRYLVVGDEGNTSSE